GEAEGLAAIPGRIELGLRRPGHADILDGDGLAACGFASVADRDVDRDQVRRWRLVRDRDGWLHAWIAGNRHAVRAAGPAGPRWLLRCAAAREDDREGDESEGAAAHGRRY